MKKYISLILFSVVAAMGCMFTSCEDKDTNLSRAVLASVSVLEYEVYPTGPQIITVTSDGDWVTEAPEWIEVSPASGSVGQTEVTITVNQNTRDNAPDNPRRGDVKFKGRDLESIATVIVRQDGDKFRDPADYSIDDMEAAAEETVVRLPGMICVSNTTKGMIATDGEQYAYVQNPQIAPVVGNKYDIVGEKRFDSNKFSYVLGERMTDLGASPVPAKTPFDITETLDNTNGKKYQYVTVAGDLEGTTVKIKGAANNVALIDAAPEANVSALDGHKVVVTGYFAGLASPFVNIIPVSLEDKGLNEVIYFADDFEWIEPWAVAANAHDYVAESETLAAESLNISQLNTEGKMLIDELYDRGYNFVKATGDRPIKVYEDRPFEKRIYLQKNYLKFSLTGIEAGVILPALKGVPDGEECELLFDWSPMRQGNPGASGRKYDETSLIVIVENGGEEVKIPVPAHTLKAGGKHEWMHANIDLSDCIINDNTKITIRSCDEKWPNYKLPADDPKDKGECAVNRWFFDNVKIRQKK